MVDMGCLTNRHGWVVFFCSVLCGLAMILMIVTVVVILAHLHASMLVHVLQTGSGAAPCDMLYNSIATSAYCLLVLVLVFLYC